MSGDLGQALPKIETALLDYPYDPRVRKYAGILRYRRKEFSAAEPLLVGTLAATPTDSEAAIFLMRVHYNSGADEKCETAARAVLEMQPRNADALRTLGRIYNRRSDWTRAAAAWRNLADVDPGNAEAPLQAARSYNRQGLSGEALKFAEEVLSLAPTNVEALSIKVDAAVALDRYESLPSVIVAYFDLYRERALALIRRLAQGRDVPVAATALAALGVARPADEGVCQIAEETVKNWRLQAVRSELQRSDKDAAIYLCALRALAPEDQTLTEGLERIKGYFIATLRDAARTGDNGAAVAAAEATLMIDPKAHEAWFAIGRARLACNDFSDAVAPLRCAIENDPENIWYLLNYARAYQQAGNLIAAVPIYRRVLEMSVGRDTPHSAEAKRVLNRLPSMLVARAREALSEGHAMEALVAHESLMAEIADNPELKTLLAASLDVLLAAVRHAYKAQSPETRLLAERYLSCDPDNAGVELMLARTLMREKAYEDALPVWKKLSDGNLEEPHYYLQIARCHARQGDGAAATAAGLKVLALDATIDEARSIIAQSQKSQSGDA
jgi:tetratricopeptide (TPR) repeat protein